MNPDCINRMGPVGTNGPDVPPEAALECPFCHEGHDDPVGGFDVYGLQWHLQSGDCPNFGRYDSRNNLELAP